MNFDFFSCFGLLIRSNLKSYSQLSRHFSAIRVLGIESTCDDTCAAVVTSDKRILSDVRFSGLKLHVARGGILPTTARANHATAINGVVKEALGKAECTINEIDFVAISYKPGLILSLGIGVDYARRLCLKYNKPLIAIHHMEAHALTAHLSYSDIDFPFLTLLISGGHTMLVLVKGIDEFYLLSESNICPVGEFLDKIARQLKIRNLGPPYDSVSGGRAIEILAEKGKPLYYSNSWVGGKSNCFNFNINNLRGFWHNKIRYAKINNPNLPVDSPLPDVADFAAGIQRSIVYHIGSRIQRIVKYLEATNMINIVNRQNLRKLSLDHLPCKIDYIDPKPVKLKLVISGGVGCNKYIVAKLKDYCDKMDTFYDETKIEVVAPSPRHLCTDNGVMIAWNGILKLIHKCDNNCVNILLREADIMSLEPVHEAQLGEDVRQLIDTSWIVIKPLQKESKVVAKNEVK